MHAATATTAKRSFRAPAWLEEEFYVIKVERWEWDFHFGINPMRHRFPAPYNDYRHLRASGELLRPTKTKAQRAQLTFVPTRRLDLDEQERVADSTEAHPVGNLSFRSRPPLLEGTLSMPLDVLPTLVSAIGTGRLNFLVLSGTALSRRQAAIASYSFQHQHDPNDLPAEGSRIKKRPAKRPRQA